MTRLTAYVRDKTHAALLHHRFDADMEAHRVKLAEIADKVYQDIFGPFRTQMEALPDGWLPTSTSLYVQFGASYERLHFSGKIEKSFEIPTEKPADVKKRVTASKNGGCLATYSARHVLTREFDQISQARIDLDTAIREASRAAWVLLTRSTTTEKLLEKWPEVEPFIPKPDGKDIRSLPTVLTETANKMLGLPV